MTSDMLNKYKDLYNSTATEYLLDMKKNLKKLKKSPSSKSILKKIYIDAHSLKSQSYTMDYLSTGNLCRAIENACEEKDSKKVAVKQEFFTHMTAALENLEKSLKSIKESGKEINLDSLTSEFT